MKWPLVSRGTYELLLQANADLKQLLDDANARIERLTELVATMRREGFTAAKPAKVTAPPDPEAIALKAAEETFIQRTIADLRRRRPDLNSAAAAQEARRLRAEIDMQDVPT